MADERPCALRADDVCTCISPRKCEEVIKEMPDVCFGLRIAFDYGKRVRGNQICDVLKKHKESVDTVIDAIIDTFDS